MKGFYKTVAVVTIFTVCEKFLGLLYRIFLSRTIGSEGIGLYQVALSVFALLLTVSCSGTPITVSRLMTKYKAEKRNDKVRSVITAGLTVTLLMSVPICLFFFLLRGNLSLIFADNRCANIFIIVLPGLIFTSVYSIMRGVFWGNKDFLSYSIIELLEEMCMIIVGIILITKSVSVYQGAYRAGVAVLVSYVFSFTLSVIIFFYKKNRLANPIKELKPLLASSVPITAMRTSSSLIVSLVSVILPMRLISSGLSEAKAMSIFGAAAGQAIPILYIPSTLIGSFTLVLIPEIAENYYGKNKGKLKTDIEKALNTSVLTSCIFIPIFLVFGEEIGSIVFNNGESGKYLAYSSYLMLLMSLSNITTSILNSIGKEKRTLIYYCISSLFMLGCIWILPKYMGIYSLLVGFTFTYGLTTVLNMISIKKECPNIKYFKFISASVLFLIPSCLFGFFLKNLTLNFLGSILCVAVCSVLTLVFHAFFYVAFGMLDIKAVFRKYFRKNNRKGKADNKIGNANDSLKPNTYAHIYEKSSS